MALSLLSLLPLSLPTVAQDVPTPRALLEASRDACLSVSAARYLGRYEEFGERHAAGVTEARVLLARGDADTEREVRFRVEGLRRFGERTQPFVLDAGFDGAAYRRRDDDAGHLYERRFEDLVAGRAAWTEAAGELGAGGSGVVLWTLAQERPYRRALASGALEYEGRTVVGDVLCDVVVASGKEPHSTTRYFLGVEDHLPRKVERIGVMLTDRIAGSILTLTDLELLPAPGPEAFAVPLPSGYTVVQDIPREQPETLVPVGSPAPPFTLRDPSGDEHGLADLLGRVVVLDFWGTWCGPCIRKLPDLQALHEANAERDVTVLGISCELLPNARPAEVFERRGITFELLLEGSDVAEAYGVLAFPTVVVIGRDGRVTFAQRGGGTRAEVQAAVNAALR